MVDGCQRAALPYRTANRLTFCESTTPFAVPRGVLTVGFVDPWRGHSNFWMTGTGRRQRRPLGVTGTGGKPWSRERATGLARTEHAKTSGSRRAARKTMAGGY